jgi:hypothetical protein
MLCYGCFNRQICKAFDEMSKLIQDFEKKWESGQFCNGNMKHIQMGGELKCSYFKPEKEEQKEKLP